MSLFDSASLCITPNGYKEDKLYSIKPSDGSGDLSVTRATTATRVNSAGLIEQVPYNFIQYSENGTISPWIANATTTANAALAPDGTMTATRVQFSSGGNRYLYQGVGLSGVVTISCYIKGATAQTIGFSDGSGNPQSIAITTEWVRYTFIYNSNSASGIQFDNYFGVSPTQQAKDFYIWGMQLVQGSSAKDYFPTTDRLDIPRLDYTNGSCPSILVEPQRTNLVTYSEDFSDAAWSKIRINLGTNTISPNGLNNGYSIIANTSNDDHFLNQAVSVVNTNVYSYSAFLKKGNKSWARLWNTSVGYADFDLENGVVGTQSSAVGSIQSFGNGWYRCSILYTANSTGANNHRIYTLNGDNNRIFAGDNSTINLYVYGVQLEQGSYPTSYIPTTSASVTRNADVISKTGISSLIGQTEGTMFIDFEINGFQSGNENRFSISDNTTANWIFIGIPEDGSNKGSRFFIRTNGSTVVDFGDSNYFNINTRYKIALAYKSGDWAVYVNGVLRNSGNNTIANPSSPFINLIFSGPNQFVSNNQQNTNNFNLVSLFKTRLTNSELAQLTTI